MKSRLARQGDYLLLALEDSTKVETGEVRGKNVASVSALTGHTHKFGSDRVRLKQAIGGANTDLVAAIPAATAFVHEEHGEIPVKKGRIYLRRQVERSSDGIRTVND